MCKLGMRRTQFASESKLRISRILCFTSCMFKQYAQYIHKSICVCVWRMYPRIRFKIFIYILDIKSSTTPSLERVDSDFSKIYIYKKKICILLTRYWPDTSFVVYKNYTGNQVDSTILFFQKTNFRLKWFCECVRKERIWIWEY